jgi:Rrf2 family protein
MRISAKTDYALRALLELAASPYVLVSSEQLSINQQIPHKFLEAIMAELRRTQLVESQRGTGGGHRLRLPADRTTLADVIRALNGPLVHVRGECPQDLNYTDSVQNLQLVWVAMRAALRSTLETVTLQDLVDGKIPDHMIALTETPGAWESHVFGADDTSTSTYQN